MTTNPRRAHQQRTSNAQMKAPESEFIVVGNILGPWSDKGKLKVRTETDCPQRFTPRSQVYIDRQPMTIDSTEWHNGKLVIKLDAINSVEDAQKLQGQTVEIHHSQVIPLPEGEYYHFQLIGLEVRTSQGALLGNITEVLSGQSNDNYIVHGVKGEILVPAIEDVIKSIDLDNGLMTIEVIDGLLDLNYKSR